jgi:hypothetical protein
MSDIFIDFEILRDGEILRAALPRFSNIQKVNDHYNFYDKQGKICAKIAVRNGKLIILDIIKVVVEKNNKKFNTLEVKNLLFNRAAYDRHY